MFILHMNDNWYSLEWVFPGSITCLLIEENGVFFGFYCTLFIFSLFNRLCFFSFTSFKFLCQRLCVKFHLHINLVNFHEDNGSMIGNTSLEELSTFKFNTLEKFWPIWLPQLLKISELSKKKKKSKLMLSLFQIQ